MSRKKTVNKRKGKKTFSIIVDGQTEVWYLQMLKKNETLGRIDIKPELPKKKKLSEQFTNVIDSSKDYDKVIWIVDFDTILKETKETKRGDKSPLEYFKEYFKHIESFDNIEVLVNTPCLEFWLLLHFENNGKFFDKCIDTEKLLKKSYIKNYEKSERFYKKREGDIYQILKEHQKTAKKNAKKLGHFDSNNPFKAVSGIYRLFEILGL